MGTALEPGTAVQSVRIESVMGAGEGTIVYAGVDPEHGAVVVKEHFPMALVSRSPDGVSVACERDEDLAHFSSGLEAFGRMYDALGTLSHPSLPRVRRLLRCHGSMYVVLNRIAGQTLEAHALQVPGMFESRIRSIFTPLIDALALLHEADLTHLGIHPGNIWLPSAGVAVWVGLRPRPADEPISPEMLGYAPVEQVRGAHTGPWTDFHALGMSMLRCVSGRPPVTAQARDQERRAQGTDPVHRILTQEWRRFSADFLDALSWMTQPDPDARPRGADPIRHVLDPHEPAWVPEGLGFSNATAEIAGQSQHREPPQAPLHGPRFALARPVAQALESAMRNYVGALAPAVVKRSLREAHSSDDVIEFLLENVPAARRDDIAMNFERLLEGTDRDPRPEISTQRSRAIGSQDNPLNVQALAGKLDDADRDFRSPEFAYPRFSPPGRSGGGIDTAPSVWEGGGHEDEIDPDWEDVFGAENAGAPWGDADTLSPPSPVAAPGDQARDCTWPQEPDAVEAALGEVVGPIARVMMRRAEGTSNPDELVVRLMDQLEEPRLQDAFIAALSART